MEIVIIFLLVISVTVVGLLARGKRAVTLESWSVGNRSFGTLILWFLMAGEIFTTAAFLGVGGWAYAYGAPVYYFMANVPLAFVLAYFLLPQIWWVGKRFGAITQADFFNLRYGSSWLTGIFAMVGIFALIPYLELQLSGLGAVLQVISNGAVPKTVSILVAAILILFFVTTGGVRSVAWTSIIKDSLMILILLSLGVAVFRVMGGYVHLFSRVNQYIPHFFSLPGVSKTYGLGWFMSTVLLVNLGYWMWPHSFATAYTAKSVETIRRNSIWMPLYALLYFFVFAAGFAAVLLLPGLKDSNGVMIALVQHIFPRWFVGLIGGEVVLMAMIPGSAIVMTAGTLIAQNIYKGLAKPDASPKQVLLASRVFLVIIMAISVMLSLHTSKTLVSLLLIAYNSVGQLAPAVILGLTWPRMNRIAALLGTATGMFLLSFGPATKALGHLFPHLNVGFVVLVINVIVTVVTAAITPVDSPELVRQFFPSWKGFSAPTKESIIP
ncbi:MAG: sodium:solute symporter family protein [Desulfitobacteriaceae bacterium]